MSSKSKRAAAAAAAATTPQSSHPPPAMVSPMSPRQLSRMQEKNALAGLNDRLAAYIDRNRELEAENLAMTKRLGKSEEETTRTVTRIKETYDKELLDSRRQVDETAKERGRLELENQQLRKENQDLKEKLAKKTKDAAVLQSNLTQLDAKFQDVTAQNNKLGSEKDILVKENKELKEENTKYARELEQAQRILDQETSARTEAQRLLASKSEEFNFTKRVMEQEIVEVKSRKVQEIQEVDGRLQQEYDTKLQESIQELRAEYEARLRENREESNALNDQKYADVRSQLERLKASSKAKADELSASSGRLDTLTRQLTALESEKNGLIARIRALEKEKDDDRQRYASILGDRDDEISKIAAEKQQLMTEYQGLMDTKIALDNEIACYRKLLEGEECRLNMTPPRRATRDETPSTRETPLRATKRKRGFLQQEDESTSALESEAVSNGDIEILADDPDGYCIRLRNKSDKEVSIAGWQLIRLSGNVDTCHKFNRQGKIEANGTLTVWSSDAAGAIHEPPHDIKMKEQKWYVSEHFKTVLLDPTTKEAAVRETKKVQVSKQRKRLGFGEPEELFHQDGARGDERCVIA